MLLSLPASRWELGISVFLASSSIGVSCQAFTSFLLQVTDLRNCEASWFWFGGFFFRKGIKDKIFLSQGIS